MNYILIFLLLLLLLQLALRRSNRLKANQIRDTAQAPDMICSLTHVPSRLHWDRQLVINNFFHNEKLYWRRKKSLAKDNPFLSITLADVSVNRSGHTDLFFSYPEDALINITEEEPTHYTDNEVLVLSISKSDFHKEPKRIFEVGTDETQYVVEMHLVHDPLDCNKAHAMFRFKFDNYFVTFEDYKNSFGVNKPKEIKKLRNLCKDELFKMIVSRIVDFE